MTDLLIITREVGYDSGVIVSIRHLAAVLEQAGISVRTCRFSTEEELWELAKEAPEACLNIHVPSFKDETLAQIMTLGKPVLLSIHSTLCNLQTEAGLLERIFRMGRAKGSSHNTGRHARMPPNVTSRTVSPINVVSNTAGKMNGNVPSTVGG